MSPLGQPPTTRRLLPLALEGIHLVLQTIHAACNAGAKPSWRHAEGHPVLQAMLRLAYQPTPRTGDNNNNNNNKGGEPHPNSSTMTTHAAAAAAAANGHGPEDHEGGDRVPLLGASDRASASGGGGSDANGAHGSTSGGGDGGGGWRAGVASTTGSGLLPSHVQMREALDAMDKSGPAWTGGYLDIWTPLRKREWISLHARGVVVGSSSASSSSHPSGTDLGAAADDDDEEEEEATATATATATTKEGGGARVVAVVSQHPTPHPVPSPEEQARYWSDGCLLEKLAKPLLVRGAEHFNTKPALGLKFLQSHHLLPTPLTAPAVAAFLRWCPGLDSGVVGEYLGEYDDFCIEVLKEHARTFSFAGLELDDALRLYLDSFRIPGEGQKIERITDAFAHAFYHESEEAQWATGPSPISVFVYACIMLNTTKHSASVKQSDKDRTTPQSFIRQLKGTNTNDTKTRGPSISLYIYIYPANHIYPHPRNTPTHAHVRSTPTPTPPHPVIIHTHTLSLLLISP
jgi:hypothetical protein